VKGSKLDPFLLSSRERSSRVEERSRKLNAADPMKLERGRSSRDPVDRE
jgi:hypothetical protein